MKEKKFDTSTSVGRLSFALHEFGDTGVVLRQKRTIVVKESFQNERDVIDYIELLCEWFLLYSIAEPLRFKCYIMYENTKNTFWSTCCPAPIPRNAPSCQLVNGTQRI